MLNGISFGQDTEFFVLGKDGEVVPAHKAGVPPPEERIHFESDEGSGSYFRDGYALEINTAPETCRGFGWYNLHDVREFIEEVKGISITTIPYVDIDRKDVRTGPDDVRIFGCSPSYNAYDKGKRIRIRGRATSVPFRTAASHFHFAIEQQKWPAFAEQLSTTEQAAPIIQLCDLFIGLFSTWIAPNRELEFKRRRLYGRAGEFRLHKHTYNNVETPGFEYRVCSSHMARHPAFYSYAWGVVRAIILPLLEETFAGGRDHLLPASLQESIQIAINTGEGLDKLMKSFFEILQEQIFYLGGYKFAEITPTWDQFERVCEQSQVIRYEDEHNPYWKLDGHYGPTYMLRDGLFSNVY